MDHGQFIKFANPFSQCFTLCMYHKIMYVCMQQAHMILFMFNLALPIRLADGNSPYSGRVEIYRNGVWGTVCDDYWTDRTAQIVCQQLGFGSRSVSVDFGVPAGTGPILMDDVNCTNGQTNLLACSHNGFGNHNCSHMEDVGVRCSRPSSGTYVESTRVVFKH